jgi:hypothetical protein
MARSWWWCWCALVLGMNHLHSRHLPVSSISVLCTQISCQCRNWSLQGKIWKYLPPLELPRLGFLSGDSNSWKFTVFTEIHPKINIKSMWRGYLDDYNSNYTGNKQKQKENNGLLPAAHNPTSKCIGRLHILQSDCSMEQAWTAVSSSCCFQ